MYHPIHVRLLLALTLATAFGVAGLSAKDARNSNSAVSPLPVIGPAEEIPMLPTVLVQAPARIPTLPLVVVRASIAAGNSSAATPLLASVSSGGLSMNLPDVLPHVRLDMPYYSFGKSLPRAIKE